MHVLRATWRISKAVALLIGLALDFLLRPSRGVQDSAERVHRCCRRLVRALGVAWKAQGDLPASGAVIANHLSYLDILLLAAVRPFVMVAKSEVRGWPLIGWITAQAGTVYVVRGGGPATYPSVNRAMAEAYRSGLPVLFFPEGTTTDGSEVLPFRRGLFHSVLNEDAAVHPAALSYAIDERDIRAGMTVANDVCWWGDATLAPHLFRLAGMQGVRAAVNFGEEVTTRRDRFELAETSRDQIAIMYTQLECSWSGEMATAHEAELAEVL